MFRSLWRRSDGGAAIEFALAAPILFLLTIGTIETGLMMFTWILMEGSLREASRIGITGTDPGGGRTRLEQIEDTIGEMTVGMINMAKAEIDVRAYPTFEDVGKPEQLTERGPANGKWDSGESYTDCNGNNQWDNDRGRRDDPGGSGEVVVYSIRYDYPLITPVLTDLIGKDGKLPLSATMVVRNEPWDTSQTAKDLKPCEP